MAASSDSKPVKPLSSVRRAVFGGMAPGSGLSNFSVDGLFADAMSVNLPYQQCYRLPYVMYWAGLAFLLRKK